MKVIMIFTRITAFLFSLALINLLFGWIIFKMNIWFFMGIILILGFLISSYILIKHMLNSLYSKYSKQKDIIEAEAEVIDDHKISK